MSPERLSAFVKYLELRHRADFEHETERKQHDGSISLHLIFPFKKTEATSPPSSTHHPQFSPNLFSCSLHLEILDENHLKSNKTKPESAS